jgi:hypothetical protein
LTVLLFRATFRSHDFDMRGIEPDVTLTMKSAKDGCDREIYLWKTPLRRVTSDEKEDEGTFMEEFEEEEPGIRIYEKKEPPNQSP